MIRISASCYLQKHAYLGFAFIGKVFSVVIV
jgi:hypothetical protein